MKGIVLTRFGDPENPRAEESSRFAAAGPGEVVVRVIKRVIHPGNLAMIRGRFHIPFPAAGFLVPGADGVGIVEAVDEEGTPRRV